MKKFFFLLCFLLISDTHAKSKHPYGLLTRSYGIVTEDDLAYDETRQLINRYDPNSDLDSLHWQCYPLKKVHAGYKQWRDTVLSPDDYPDVCALQIWIDDKKDPQLYTDHRGRRLEDCVDFIKEWHEVTDGEKNVCLNGEGGSFYTDEKGKTYKLWTWVKSKTKHGCHSFFYGECNTKGCAEGKCPAE
jgi:hypothetical protein